MGSGTHIATAAAISGLGGHVGISGCPSLLQSFKDNFFGRKCKLCHLNYNNLFWIRFVIPINMSVKFRQFQKNPYMFDGIPYNFRCTGWWLNSCIMHCCITPHPGSHEMARPSARQKDFLCIQKLSWRQYECYLSAVQFSTYIHNPVCAH